MMGTEPAGGSAAGLSVTVARVRLITLKPRFIRRSCARVTTRAAVVVSLGSMVLTMFAT